MKASAKRRVWNVLAGLLFAVLLCELAIALFRVCPPVSLPSFVSTPRVPAVEWRQIESSKRLAPAFFWNASLQRAPGESDRFRATLMGQTRLLVLEGDRTSLRLAESAGVGHTRPLGTCTFDPPLREGDVLALQKKPGTVGVFRNGVRLLFAPCRLEEWRRGRWEAPGPPGTPPLLSFTYQKTAPLAFADDFMHGEGELGAWEAVSGRWTVHEVDNPIRSANAFSLRGVGEMAVVQAGRWFWHDYDVSLAVHPLRPSAFGLLLCRTDSGSAYRIEWRRGTASGEAGVLRLVRSSEGFDTVLDETVLDFVPSQWYELRAANLAGDLSVWVDGLRQLRAIDPQPLLGGQVGLWSDGGDGVVFDDVRVTPADSVEVAFGEAAGPSPAYVRARDAQDGGGWRLHLPVLGNVALRVRLEGLNRLTGPLELVARERGSGHVALRVSPAPGGAVAELLLRQGSGTEVKAHERLGPLPEAGWLSLHAHGPRFWGCLDDRMVAIAADSGAHGQGNCRILGADGGMVKMSSARVEAQGELPPLENWVETFAHEESMKEWGRPEAEWKADYSFSWTTYWHRSDFWRGVGVVLDLDRFRWRETAGRCGVALAGGEAASLRKAAAQLGVFAADGGAEARLTLGEDEPRTRPLPPGARRISLERRSGRLLAWADEKLLWSLPLPEWLTGLVRVGRFGGLPGEDWARAANIGAEGARTYSFKRAPVDWVPVAGTWTITNRWECDPRWSFFSGSQRRGVACNWSKLRHGDNVSLEFFIGPKMDSGRGKRYEYVGDMNAVLCADGEDVSSGYCFMFGGWNDSGSFITRGKEVIGKDRRTVVPRESATHRRWFHVKLRKHGEKLTFWVDGNKAVEADAPEPLKGRRFGLWTWDNGIMIAQLRLTTDSELTAQELLSTQPRVPKTPYD